MNQYVDAEKLIAEVERRISAYQKKFDRADNKIARLSIDGRISGLKNLLPFIAYLQQEQPMPNSTQLIEWWHKDKEILKKKDFRNDPWRLAYNAFMCGFGRGLAVKQEQPEVDLEKELRNYNVPFNDCGWERLTHNTLKEIARHFWNKGYNARKEEQK